MRDESKFLGKYIEFNKDKDYPSMEEDFCAFPYEGKEMVIKYLELGEKTVAACGRARDFFTGELIPGERCLMTDGEYSWPSSLSYYVGKYNLRLPSEFVEKVMRNGEHE